MRVIIAGDREYDRYEEASEWMDVVDETFPLTGVISGGARGADTMGEQWAKEVGHSLEIFPAKWDEHGKAAGPIRNAEMAKAGDLLLAFLAPGSKGTRNMVETMIKAEKLCIVVPVRV